MTFTEQMQSIVNQYANAGEPWPATSRQMADWAIRKKLWEPQRSNLIDQCAHELSKAMREEYIVDPQGRTVRAKHAARMKQNGEQTTLWADIRTASRSHMAVAFQQRRQQVLGECRQLKADVDSFNENANAARPIQMIFDFTMDLEELSTRPQPSTIVPRPPSGRSPSVVSLKDWLPAPSHP